MNVLQPVHPALEDLLAVLLASCMQTNAWLYDCAHAWKFLSYVPLMPKHDHWLAARPSNRSPLALRIPTQAKDVQPHILTPLQNSQSKPARPLDLATIILMQLDRIQSCKNAFNPQDDFLEEDSKKL